MRRLSDNAEWVSHTYEVMDAIAEINASLREAEAIQRTFLIVGGDHAPDDFATNIDGAHKQLGVFQGLTVDNRRHQAAIPDVEQRIAQLADVWSKTMQVRIQEGFEAASRIVATNRSRLLMGELERDLRKLDSAERELLQQRLRQREATYDWSVATGLLSGMAAIAGVVAFIVLLRRHLADRASSIAIIAEQRERLRTTLASIGDAVITTDTAGLVTGMNAVAESLTGWAIAEAKGQPLGLVFHIVNESTRQPVENPVEKALAGGCIVGLANHTVLIARNGAELPIDDSAAPIRCADGEIVGCVLVFRDIAERRNLEQENATRLAGAQLLATIVETSNDAIISKTLEGIIQSWNSAAERLFGYSSDEAVGQHIFLIIPPDRHAEEDEIVARLRAGKRIEHYETARRRKDGETISVALTISPIYDDSGCVIGASKIARDITDRIRSEAALRESEERFRTLADNMSQLCWMTDATGWIFWYNQRWLDYTGSSLEEMQGWGWKQVHDPEHVERVVTRFQYSLDTGELWEDTFPLRGKDGSYRWFLSRAVPIRDDRGNIVRWFGTNTDVTEQRQLENDLRSLAADLSQADRRKDEFLATLAHELRNPLAAIHGAAELLKVVSSSDPEFPQTLDVVHRQSQVMVRLIDDLMDVSRITRGKLTLRRERIDLATVIEQAVETTRSLIDDAQQQLTVDVPENTYFLDGDAVRLTQVFSNLLNNSAKYSEKGGRIHVAARQQGPTVVVSISDTGIGIAPEQLPRIFEMFSQIDSVLERSQGGLGIGLALVRGLVEMHDGSVEAHSAGLNQGSEFVVQLPLVGEPTSDAMELAANGSQLTNCEAKILIADDNRDLAQTLAAILRIKGHEVVLAFDGAEALRVANDMRPQILLLDIGMPEMNGLELAKHVRQQAWGKQVLLVAMTGWGQDEDKRRTQVAGFDHHLTKPVSVADLDTVLASFDCPTS